MKRGRAEHELGGWIRVFKREILMGFDREGFRVKRDNVYAVVVVFSEAAQGNALVLVCARWGRRDCHGIERVWRFIGYGVF